MILEMGSKHDSPISVYIPFSNFLDKATKSNKEETGREDIQQNRKKNEEKISWDAVKKKKRKKKSFVH
jgi:hypothetical protein